MTSTRRLYDGWWELCQFTDGDIGDVAVGRFEAFEDGETLMELLAALRSLPPIPAPVRKPKPTMTVALIGNGLFVQVGRKR